MDVSAAPQFSGNRGGAWGKTNIVLETLSA